MVTELRIMSHVAGLTLACLAVLWPASAAADPARLPRDNLLLFHDAAGDVRPVTSLADWERRRAEIRRGMESVMGVLPGDEKKVPLDVRVEEEVDGGAFVRRLVTYVSEPGCRTPAYLLIPKSALADGTPAPAVLALHGTDMEIGHGSIVGLGDRENRGYASELAERGYVVLAPSYPLMAAYQPDLRKLGWKSGTLKAVWDNIRGLDLLASLPFAAGARCGAIGHSLGGHNSVYTAVFDPRLVAVVSSCGLDSYVDYYGGDQHRWTPGRGWCQLLYMPLMANYRGRLQEIPFDFHEMIATLAPRHMLIIAPSQDHNFQAASVDRIAAAARDVYSLYGAPDHLRVLHPACQHDFPREMREEAYRLFDSVLK